ncbi:MAG TPA: hypothetical protein VJV23_00765 [Candidatus Polarisedimenticolia bacterium]|nr:hypothetical protein [Candidatus Polarisedimenticolia bacterium]
MNGIGWLRCTIVLAAGGMAASLQAASPAVAAPAAAGDPRDTLKSRLAAYYADAGRLAPTAIGDLARDPATLASVQQEIDSLGPERLAALDEALAAVPGWEAAPEALSSAFQTHVLGDQAARRSGDLEGFRSEVSELYALLRLLPEPALRRLRQDPGQVLAMQERLHTMPANALALLKVQMDAQGDWRSLKSRLLSSVSPAALEGIRSLARNGPLQDGDYSALGEFRRDLDRFVADLRRIPSIETGGLGPRLADLEAGLRRATPEMLFVIRQRAGTAGLRQAMGDARVLAGAADLTSEEREALERFRAELAGAYALLGDFAPGDPGQGSIADRIGSLPHEALLLARSRLQAIPEWRRTLPAVLSVLADPSNRAMMALLENGRAAAETMDSLAAFRAVLLERLSAAPGGAEAAALVREASPRDLFLMREAGARLPEQDALSIRMVPQTVSALSAPQYASVSFNCSCPDHGLDLPLGIGCVSMQFLCNIMAAPINLALAGVDAAMNGLRSAVSSVENVIDDVAGTVAQVAGAIEDLPGTLLGALTALFESIAAAVLNEFSPQNLASKLGLVEGFWSSLPVLPQIPCPPDGFNLHPFGEVGEDLTASKYARYLFVFDKILEIIPDTEVSLTLKIPAQVLYGGIQYLGVCLHDAAMARSEQATSDFRAQVAGKLDASLSGLGGAQNGIAVLQSQVAGVQSQVGTQGQELTALIKAAGAGVSGDVARAADELSEQLTTFQDEELRLKIEANLAQPERGSVASFQLPESFGGMLESVRLVVEATIVASRDAGLATRAAEDLLRLGDQYAASGNYRGAYAAYGKAYRQAAAGVTSADLGPAQ